MIELPDRDGNLPGDSIRAGEKRPDVTANDMSGLLPHFTIARTKSGTWACYKLTPEGCVRITLSYYSPADAAERLEQYLRQNEETLK